MTTPPLSGPAGPSLPAGPALAATRDIPRTCTCPWHWEPAAGDWHAGAWLRTASRPGCPWHAGTLREDPCTK